MVDGAFSHRAINPTAPQLASRLGSHFSVYTYDRRGDAVEFFFTQALRLPAGAIAGMREGPFWVELEKVAHTLPYDGTIMEGTMSGRALPAERWASVTAPTLVIDGGAGEAFMHTGADALARILPDAQRRTLEGQTHDVAAEAIAPVLEEFFAG